MNDEAQNTPFAIKAIKFIVVFSITAPIVLVVVLFVVFISVTTFHKHELRRADNEAYEQIAAGMTWGEVEAAHGSPPDHTTEFDPFRVHYYIDPVRYSMHPDNVYPYTLSDRVKRKDELPVSEGAKQYLVLNDVVIARSWIAEDPYVHFEDGKIEGKSIRDLPDEFFEKAANR